MVRIGDAGIRVALMAVLVCLGAAACARPTVSPSPLPAVTADGILLPGTTWWPAPPATPPPCAGVGLDAILHGGAADPAITWIEDRASGGRGEVTWPTGFRARFEPDLLVVDLTGRIVHREGDAIDGGCSDGDRILLGYP